ncbi:XdhC protein [Halalkalibacter wakoensis JCM 9140]|uniref:XdhC protein n=1 Tax=Halalkalibacter wakoensis JCM 9140 TaxID=1236970 RepID=W4Q286_9BACI|nr:XdhC family protein [Halalkalibacter wakoensis]GAE26097.1 XdhC protein [Halalkalibacter wakoensis JCM 9140]
MKELYNFLSILKQYPEQTSVLATVIQVQGSAYRHEGAKMLFLEKGSQYGMISGGCLEDDLRIRAKDVMKSEKAETATYDLRSEDDLDWGQGAGCNGKITVLLEPFSWDETVWSAVLETFGQGNDVISVRKFSGGEIGPRCFFTTGGLEIGEVLHTDVSFHKDVQQFYQQQRLFEYQLNFETNAQYLFELHEAKDMVYIFGAGADVEPVVKRLAEFDFLPIVIDPREARCNNQFFPNAHRLIQEHPETFLKRNETMANAYVLIMTHSFTRDQLILSAFLQRPPRYLGILGPRRRTERLLQSESVPKWVHSPIGMNIDAEGAEEISISILGELIKVRNQKRVLNKKRKRAQVQEREVQGQS